MTCGQRAAKTRLMSFKSCTNVHGHTFKPPQKTVEMHAHAAKSLDCLTVKGKKNSNVKSKINMKKICAGKSEIEKQSPHIWRAPLPSPPA